MDYCQQGSYFEDRLEEVNFPAGITAFLISLLLLKILRHPFSAEFVMVPINQVLIVALEL